MPSTNLETTSNDLEKENPLTAEALGSTLLNKDNIELKTEIPFSDEVWNTALLKSLGDLIELDFLELQDVIEVEAPKHEEGDWKDYHIFVNILVPNVVNGMTDGTFNKVKLSLAKYLGELYKRQIGYSEEYAISHHRKGREEVAGMVGQKLQAQAQKKQDILGDVAKH